MKINIAQCLFKMLEKETFAKHTKAIALSLQAAHSRMCSARKHNHENAAADAEIHKKKEKVLLKSRRNPGRRKYLNRLLMTAPFT